jgi:site-specific recombinase XerD
MRPYKGRLHLEVVQDLIDHTQIGLTLDTYSHVLPGMGEEE